MPSSDFALNGEKSVSKSSEIPSTDRFSLSFVRFGVRSSLLDVLRFPVDCFCSDGSPNRPFTHDFPIDFT